MSQLQSTPLHGSTPRLATTEIFLQKLLVPVDFSKHSHRAAQQAIAIANCFGSEILLAHAATPAVYGTGLEPIPICPYEMELDISHDRMAEFVHDEPGLEHLKHEEFSAYAIPADYISALANDQKVDLIVAGSHSAGGLERLALGSVAESILAAVKQPVMIVGPKCRTQVHPFRSILFATDLKMTGLRAAQYAAFLAERFHSRLTLLHVVEKKPSNLPSETALAEEKIRHDLTCLLPPELDQYTNADLRVEYGKPYNVICDIARAEATTLIVTGFCEHALGDNSPWSTLSHIIREAPCPVLSVHRHCA